MGLANKLPGLYIVLDGIIGCGKSAQIKELKNRLPLDFPNSDIVFTFEPGGTPDTEDLRTRLKTIKMEPEEEMKLFAESGSKTIPQVVVPALARGGVVLSDRSVSTSLTYQAFGRNLGLNKVWDANKEAVNGILPDIVLWMNVGREECFRRSSGVDPDKFDNEDAKFWDRVIEGYASLPNFLSKISPATKFVEVSDPQGSLGIEEMRLVIKKELYPFIENNFREGRIVRKR